MSLNGRAGAPDRLLRAILIAILTYAAFRAAGFALGWNPPWLVFADVVEFTAPVGFMILLCLRTLGTGRGAFFLALAFAVSTSLEFAGLRGTGIFGPAYQYHFWPKALGLPFLIPAYWMGVAFFSYSFVSSFLTWTGREKPRRGRGQFAPLALLVLADGLFVAAVDLALDPIAAGIGLWSWSEAGPFFGIPIQNFLGWFVIGALISAVFRGVEFLRPAPPIRVPDATVLLSVIGYGTIGFGLVLQAWARDFPAIAVIPPLTIGPAIALNVALYLTRRPTRPE